MQEILSVGIDIGTSTTQLVFSKIAMENLLGYFAVPRVSIVDKRIVYRSEVHITPLKNAVLIDGDAVREIVMAEYQRAGFSPEDVDTGAVIITGESARKENAAAVLDSLSGLAGEFVVSTAGPDLESVIAGKGSGAWQTSIDGNDTIANLDVGGGTTNIVVFDSGDTVAKGCYDIGGRLIRIGTDHRISYVSEAAAKVAHSIGYSVRPGDAIDMTALSEICKRMAALLGEALFLTPRTPLLEEVRTPESSALEKSWKKISGISFSGGVADCMQGENRGEPFRYGDIGPMLGSAILESELCKRVSLVKSTETIRATVVGAGMYTTSLTGSTIHYAPELLPLKNVPVLCLTAEEQEACFSFETGVLKKRVQWFLNQVDGDRVMVSFSGKRDPDYRELQQLAAYLSAELDSVLPQGAPVLIAVENDIAKALGIQLLPLLKGKRKLVCIDGVKVEQGDYIDLGRPVMNGMVIPVIVKTLLFG